MLIWRRREDIVVVVVVVVIVLGTKAVGGVGVVDFVGVGGEWRKHWLRMKSDVSRSWVVRWERRDGVVSFSGGREGRRGVFVGVAGFGACGMAGRLISRTICVLLTKMSSQGSGGMVGGSLCGARRERAC